MTATGRAGLGGHPPKVLIGKSEKAKYEEVWQHARYRQTAPGEHYVKWFLENARPLEGDTLIDFGCGTGRGGALLHTTANLDVTLMDFAVNCLDDRVRRQLGDTLRFVEHDLTVWPYPTERARFGYCCDVLEHIPPAQVPKVLKNILRAATNVFFAISTQPDKLGGLIGEPLHLTVEPFEWWQKTFEDLGCKIRWSKDAGGAAFFYLTAFADAEDFRERMKLNTSEEVAKANIKANLDLGLQEVCPHEEQPDVELMLLAGGPSLGKFADDIYQKAAAGMHAITVNGSYKWAIDHNILPAAQIILDARSFNRRFVDPVLDNCKYLLCSQCDNELVASLPKDQVWLWHSGASKVARDAIDEWSEEHQTNRKWWPVYGGSTVILRAIPLLRMLGFNKLHVYGFDSCLLDDEHHAYPQTENDSKNVIDVAVGGKKFKCHTWMLAQANEFMDLTRAMADVCELEVYGDGLIAHIIRTAASLPITDEAKPYFISTKED